MKTSKGVLLAFVVLTAFKCSTFELAKPKVESITDEEIIELKKAFVEHVHVLLDSGQIKKFPTYQEFLTNAAMQEKERLNHDLNIQPIEGLSVYMKIYNLNLSETEFMQLEIRINSATLNNQNARISGL